MVMAGSHLRGVGVVAGLAQAPELLAGEAVLIEGASDDDRIDAEGFEIRASRRAATVRVPYKEVRQVRPAAWPGWTKALIAVVIAFSIGRAHV